MNMPVENSLMERIGALNVATELLVPNLDAGSRPVVMKWLKADLAALEQLRKQIKREEREGVNVCSSALGAMIQAKHTVLSRLDKKKTRARAKKTLIPSRLRRRSTDPSL